MVLPLPHINCTQVLEILSVWSLHIACIFGELNNANKLVTEFQFYPQNHSVARSAWKSPCIPYEYSDLNKQGFFSGFHALAIVMNEPPKFQVRVNDTEPIFFYCSAPGACIEEGMIGVINPTIIKNFDTQL